MGDDKVIDLLQLISRNRAHLHRDHASSRPLSEGYEDVGMAGEVEFARQYRQPLDFEDRPGGDRGVDFWLPMMFSVDVKCARMPNNLLVEEGKATADIYVLAKYYTNVLDAKLIGWEWGGAVAKAPKRDFGKGVISHYIAAPLLRPMTQLRERIAVIGFGFNAKVTT